MGVSITPVMERGKPRLCKAHCKKQTWQPIAPGFKTQGWVEQYRSTKYPLCQGVETPVKPQERAA